MRWMAISAVLLWGCAQHHVCDVGDLDGDVPPGAYRWQAITAPEDSDCFVRHDAIYDLDGEAVPLECEPIPGCGPTTFRCGTLLYVAELRWDGAALEGEAVITRHDAFGEALCTASASVRAWKP